MAKRPTEEDLGIAPTAEEMAEQSSSARPQDDDGDISREDEGGEEQHLVAKKPETEVRPDDNKAVAIRDPETGKFARVEEGKPAATPEVRTEPVKPPPGFVDQRALREAREQNRVLEERFNTLMEVVNKRNQPEKVEPAAPVVPDKVSDPYGYIDYIEGRVGALETETKAQKDAREAGERESQEVGQALAVARPQFEEAAAADAALMPTYGALLESYAREIAYLNRANPEFQRDQRGFLAREMTKLENGHIKFAVASGQNVVEYMRGLAASRGIGAPAPAQQQVADTVVATPPRTIAERQQQQQRHQSLGDLPGTGVPAQVTAKDIGRMSPAQFKKFAKDLGEAGLDALMGKD